MRKKIFKGLALAIVGMLGVVGLGSCDNQQDDPNDVEPAEATIEEVTLIPGSVPASIKTAEVATKVTELQLRVYMSDKTTKTVNVTAAMVGQAKLDELAALTESATKLITITYEGFTLTANLVMVAPEPVVDTKTLTITPANLATIMPASDSVTTETPLFVYTWNDAGSKFSKVEPNEAGTALEAEIPFDAVNAIYLYCNVGEEDGSWDTKIVQSADLTIALGSSAYEAYPSTAVTADLTTLLANCKVITELPAEYDLYIWTWGGYTSVFAKVAADGSFKAPTNTNGGCFVIMEKGAKPSWDTKVDQTYDYNIVDGVATPKPAA